MRQILLIGLLTLCCACHPVKVRHDVRQLPPAPEPSRDLIRESVQSTNLAEVTPAPRPETIVDPGGVERPKPDIEAALRELQDAFFDYDRSDPNPQAVAALRRDADLLRAVLADFPALMVVIEGHCDERGSAEYNLALGARRASRAAEYLYEFGWPKNQAQTVSYGKEAPQCTDPTESCWSRNRRAHLSVKR